MNPAPETLKKTTPFEASPRPESRPRTRRFMYACGAKPLDGYTIKRGIGIGGFGEVYFAVSDAGKEVALKRIERNFDIEMRGVIHCLNLKHVNLISLWDVRTDPHGTGWVVMEYVPGESLKDVVEGHANGMELDALTFWFRGVVEGVRYLHDRGIVHRDLKPGNIFRDSDADVVKIGDYGLSKLISAGSPGSHTETVGTFHYMAPEISRGSYGKEVDLYALGVILYEMLTGVVPFDGETSHEIVMKHLTMDPDMQRVPERFASLVRNLLQKDPGRRCRDAVELKRLFEAALAPVSIAVASTNTTPRPTPPSTQAGTGPARDLMFITEDSLVIPDGADMVFGDVVEVVTAESIEIVESRAGAEVPQTSQTPERRDAASPGASLAVAAEEPVTRPSNSPVEREVVGLSEQQTSQTPPVQSQRRWATWFPKGQRASRIEVLSTLVLAMPLLAFASPEFRWLAFPILMIPIAFEWMRLGQLGDAGRSLQIIGDELDKPTRRLKIWHRWGISFVVVALGLLIAVSSELLGEPLREGWAHWVWLVCLQAGITALWLARQTFVKQRGMRVWGVGVLAAALGGGSMIIARELHAGWYSARLAESLEHSIWSSGAIREVVLGCLLGASLFLLLERDLKRRRSGANRFLGLVVVQSMALGFILDFVLWMPWGWGAVLMGLLVLSPITAHQTQSASPTTKSYVPPLDPVTAAKSSYGRV